MKLSQWAMKHDIDPNALGELRELLGGVPLMGIHPVGGLDRSEAAVQVDVRLEASRKGVRLMRNNVGACMDENGRLIRYGLCNDTKAMNEKIKSHDLVGIRPVMITKSHVGTVIGQFISRECKREGWKFTGTDHEMAQLAFTEFVVSNGGDAMFCTEVGSI